VAAVAVVGVGVAAVVVCVQQESATKCVPAS
jgi:hypothetical protein